MSGGIKRDSRPLMGWVTMAGGTFVLVYWALYFTRAVDLGQDDQLVNAFESAFPIADAVFAAALFAASFTLLTRRWPGPFFLVSAGSISLYLGILDTTFYVGRGIFLPIDAEAVLGLTINGICMAGGIVALLFGWRYWRSLAFQHRPAARRSRNRVAVRHGRRPSATLDMSASNEDSTKVAA